MTFGTCSQFTDETKMKRHETSRSHGTMGDGGGVLGISTEICGGQTTY